LCCQENTIQWDSNGVKNKFLIDSLHSSDLGLVSPRLDGRSQGIWLKAAHGVLTHIGTLKLYICRAKSPDVPQQKLLGNPFWPNANERTQNRKLWGPKLTSLGDHLRCDIWKEFGVLKMGDPQVTMIVSI